MSINSTEAQKNVSVLLTGMLFMAFLAVAGQSENTERPNVLVIMVDDLSVADISLNGNTLSPTPHIDRLAEQSIHFSQAFVTSPICSPSRASFITGRYAQRFGFQFQMHERYPKSWLEYLGFKWFVNSYPWIPKKPEYVPNEDEIAGQGLPDSEITLAQLLKKEGYTTGLVGKWHLGWNENKTPCDFGFDYQYGFYGSHSLYVEEKSSGYIDQKVKKDFTDAFIWKGQRKGAHAIYKNCKLIEEDGYLTDRITEEAEAFLKGHKDTPFFLWVSYNAPHTPFQCKQSHYDQLVHIKDPIKRVYHAMIMSLDENIGRLMATVSQLKLLENTLVVFMSDNGGAEYTFATDNGPYKGGKITDLEGGIRVPLFIKWPGTASSGNTYKEPVVTMDVFATIVQQTGAKLPGDRTYDGVDLSPFVHGEKSGLPHEYLYWKRGIASTIRSNTHKLFLNEVLGDTLLFNIQSDPYENHNIYPENKTIAREMARALKEWSSTLPEPLWPPVIYYEFKDGENHFLFDQ